VAANSSFDLPVQPLGRDLPLDSSAITQDAEFPCLELVAATPPAGLKTYQYFDEQLRQEIPRAEASGSPVALLAIEIDGFGILGDLHGQSFRNDLLRDIASNLSRNARPSDTVAHCGGRKFAILLPATNTAEAYCLAERLREDIESTCILAGLPPEAVWVKISVGLALFPRDARSTRELLVAADAGLLEAKRNGGNRVVLHSELEFEPGTRREQRLCVALPVQIWGMDLDGALFEQDAATIDITTTGARLTGITHSLQRGCVIGVKHQTSKARYRVVWVGEASSATPREIGIQLIDGGKFIWGRAIPRIFGDDEFAAARSRQKFGE
jgi:diguanylate cyclase (GGDEF)-like protein